MQESQGVTLEVELPISQCVTTSTLDPFSCLGENDEEKDEDDDFEEAEDREGKREERGGR